MIYKRLQQKRNELKVIPKFKTDFEKKDLLGVFCRYPTTEHKTFKNKEIQLAVFLYFKKADDCFDRIYLNQMPSTLNLSPKLRYGLRNFFSKKGCYNTILNITINAVRIRT